MLNLVDDRLRSNCSVVRTSAGHLPLQERRHFLLIEPITADCAQRHVKLWLR